ncbi:vacuolar protein sorting-associated protein 26A-like isoform 2-T2 [Salvelinus alpinus]
MELQWIKKEMTGIGPSTTTETETVAKYDIMDGAPVKGESIPIRLFLAGYDLTATMRDVNKKFSVRYFLNLVLVDEEDRRYFKQQVQNIKANLHLPVCRYCSKTADTLYTVPDKSLDTPTHSRVFLYFDYFLHCRTIVKTSKL